MARVAMVQGGKAEEHDSRSSIRIKARLHRIELATALYPGKGRFMHLSTLHYSYQLGRRLMVRLGLAGSVGRLQQIRDGPLYLAVTVEPTFALGREWRIGKVGAFGVLGELFGGVLFSEGRSTYVIRPRVMFELSYGRLAWFGGPGFMYHPLYEKPENATLDIALNFGMSIAL